MGSITLRRCSVRHVANERPGSSPGLSPFWGSGYAPRVAEIPLLVKHMTIAVLGKAKLPGDHVVRFENAFKIARGRCVQYGLIGPDGESDHERIGLTAKGTEKELAHRRERGGHEKTELFDSLYTQFQMRKAAEGKPAVPRSDEGRETRPHGPATHPTHNQAMIDKIRATQDRIDKGT